MQTIDIVKSVDVSRSTRAKQLESMFDVPASEKLTQSWKGNIDIDGDGWNIGLIVGPSGCGKSTIAKELFKNNYGINLSWNKKSIIDDFNDGLSIEQITKACGSVGLNTIPSWLKPYNVLSTGEKFRVDMARRILELESPIVIDEFTSVVDRQVAKIGCHAIQKFIRKYNKRFVAVSCHYDIVDWLQPDWIFEPETMTQKPRGLLQRPKIETRIRRVKWDYWKFFSKYHYMNADLNRSAKCFCLFVNDQPVSFCGIIHTPLKIKNFKRISRAVTLPDYQGIGFIHVLSEAIGSAYKSLGYRLRAYPKHAIHVRSMYKLKNWKVIKKPSITTITTKRVRKSVNKGQDPKAFLKPKSNGAILEYIGPMMDIDTARKLIDGY